MKIVSLFDRSGVMVKPWYEAGHDVVTVDFELPRHRMPAICSDIASVDIMDCDVLFSFVPCTEFAGSGARWWADKPPEKLDSAWNLVEITRRWLPHATWWMVENPVGRLSRLWRPPDWSFDPSDFGGYSSQPADNAYTKRTCIWSNFDKPPMKAIDPVDGSKMHLIPPGPDRQYLRSITPDGFAQAIFEHLSEKPPAQLPLFHKVAG